MTQRILKLDERTASKIAAGEVVERPAMVVKELVENAIDAGATEITVEIDKGGKQMIRVSDNGSGIHYEDIPLVFERHATSKIRSIEDLYNTHSLGFRGEALASICAVSNVELITMRETEKNGKKVIAAGGKIQKITDIGTVVGTTIIVKDLFFNTPARLKFLKSDQTEGRSISELMGYLALSHPEVSIKYLNDGKSIFHTQGKGSLKNAIFSVFESSMLKGLYEISDAQANIRISGFISKFDYTKGTRAYQLVFINGRYVKSDLIKEAIQMAYRPYMMNNRYPVCILFLEIPPNEIDVNIHPAKTEVKFHDDGLVKQFVYSALKKAFNLYDQVPQVTFTEKEVFSVNTVVKSDEKAAYLEREVPVAETVVKETFVKTPQMNSKEQSASDRPVVRDEHSHHTETSNDDDHRHREESTDSNEQRPKRLENNTHLYRPETPKMDFSSIDFTPLTEFAKETLTPMEGTIYDDLQFIGAFNKTYLIYEKNQELYLVDQHAAHEKVLYEAFMEAYQQHAIQSQLLLIPEVIELESKEVEQFQEFELLFQELGFQVELFGERSVVVREIPSMLSLSAAKELVTSVMEESHHLIEEKLHHQIAEKACKAAIKAHDAMDFREQLSLVDQLKRLKSPYTCPHGRPIIIRFSLSEIEKKFKRIL